MQCTASDIAVLCAYWQQVRLVRKYLRQMGLGAIRVGVVDDYQGQESPITIVSCVLTQPRQQVDILSPLTGLLGNVKRVNVALTRAMGLSIVVASASFLKSDMYFQRLLKYCWKNNSVYTDRNLNEFIVTEDDIDDETKNIHMTTATASNDKNNNKKKETLKDYDDYEDDEDLILNHLKDFAVLNLNDVNAVECVRNSAVDEFVSMSCGYEFKWATDEACQVWMDIFRKSYETQDEMDYDWIQLARCLEGNGNPEETAHIEYGGGANGKGLKSTGTISALGPYCATLSNSCLVYNRYKKKDGHDINLWTARKARVWLLSEMNEGENIDMEQFKRMTGSDPIAVRTHQQKEMTYIMAPPIRISLNHLPVLKGNKEESLQRRIEAKVYKQTFVSKDKYEKLDEEEKKTHYVIDTTLKGQMKSKEVKCIIMTILIKYFKRFKNKQFTVPASIVADTKWFLDNTDVNDKYKEWFDTNVIQDQGKGYNVVVCHLLKYFNSENNTKFNSRQFYKKLKYFGYEIKNSSGFPLKNDQGNFTRQSEKLKTTCIIKVTLPHVQTFGRI